jgi:hypothetical protein
MQASVRGAVGKYGEMSKNEKKMVQYLQTEYK